MRQKLGLGGKSNDVHSRRLREEAINCYIEMTEDGQFKKIARAPLYDLVSTVGSGPIRGFCVAAGSLYLVSGTEFYKVQVSPFGGMSATLKGTVFGNTGLVSMAAIGGNQPQVIAVTNNAGFLYDDTTGLLTQIADPNFDPTFSVTAFNERFFLNRVGTGEFFCSDPYPGGATYNALNFDTADNTPDIGVAISSVNTEVVVFCRTHIERWQSNDLPVGFPLSRIQGGTIQRGCASAQSVIRGEGSIFWLADDYTVRALYQGGQMIKISDLAFEQDVLGYSNPQFAFGQYIDYPFYKAYCLTFPGNNVTWCYEVNKRTWHKRASTGVDGWRMQTACLFNNMTLMGDRFNGNIYQMNYKTYTEAGQQVNLSFTCPSVFSDDAPMTVSLIELVCDMGVGTINNVDSLGVPQAEPLQPQISLFTSKDGGYNFTDQGFRPLGRIGHRNNKVIWRPGLYFPRGNEMVNKFTVSDPVDFNAYSLYGDVDIGV